MIKLRIFIAADDPDCEYAKDVILRLLAENEKFEDVSAEFLDEKTNASLSDGYDYIFLPAVFVCRKEEFAGHKVFQWIKLHEGHPTEESLIRALEKALKL